MNTSIDGIDISFTPTNPTPNERVTVSLVSYSIDLNSASIVWLSNGETLTHGVGMKEISVKAPSIGKRLIISTIIKGVGGREVRKNITIQSGSIDLIFEPISYAPPFYKGKNPLVYQNKIKLIAVPHLSLNGIKELDPKNLVYTWKIGGKYIDGASGYGKQSVIINSGNIPKTLDISLEVYNQEQTINTTRAINLEPTDPSLIFYEINPLYGTLFNKAITNRISLNDSEITVLASPFGFNSKNLSLNYIWSINNIDQPSLSKKQSITLKTKGSVAGISNIDLDIRNIENILQGARSSFSINFDRKKTSNNNQIF
jgi:hypothetical protein